MSAFLGFYTMSYADKLSRASAVLNICFMGPLLVVIYFIYFFLRTRKRKLDEISFRNKYEALYINLDLKKKNCWWFCHIFLLRRFTYMLVIVFMENLTGIQIAMYLNLSLLWMSYMIAYEPMLRSQWRMTEYANEMTILICGYVIIFFTDYIPDAELRYKIGWLFIIVLLIDMLFNWTLIVLLPFI